MTRQFDEAFGRHASIINASRRAHGGYVLLQGAMAVVERGPSSAGRPAVIAALVSLLFHLGLENDSEETLGMTDC